MNLAEIFALPDLGPNKWHEFKHNGSIYRISLPPHFLTEQTKDRDYCEWLLATRLDRGYIPASDTSGIIAGAYQWEKVEG